MHDHPVRYAVLRDRRRWEDVALAGLATELDGTVVLTRAAGAAASGVLTSGPLDAGVLGDWERVHVDAEREDGDIVLDLYTSADPAAPAAGAWTRARTLDALVQPFGAQGEIGSRRYLWLRVTLSCGAAAVRPPRIAQVQAETRHPSYLDHLPAVYRRRDTADGFLERWLALFRAELGDLERVLDDMPRRLDAGTAPEDHLAWLSSWLGFRLPDGIDADAARALIARVPELYRRRGTPAGVADFVEIYAGVRPHVVEAYRTRAIWQLGVTSRLGFDTGLVPAPDGMIVAGDTPADPALMGLRGDYHRGTRFETLLATRVDRTVAFDWEAGAPHPAVPADGFSVRWTGQVRPRYSESYTFYTKSDDGVRLWVDGQLIVDDWVDHALTERSGRIALSADRWHSIRLEFYENLGLAAIELGWASRSQQREVVPQACLYAVMDDGVRLAAADPDADAGLLVGQTVVGESAPQTKPQFGELLFSETAHLFSVVVPADAALTTRQRRTLRDVIEAEKPAHTDFHLCFAGPRMRVGIQATVGVDAIVGGPPDPLSLSGTVLGVGSWLGSEDATAPCADDAIVARDALHSAQDPRR